MPVHRIYDKPALHVIVDLMNRVLIKNFRYSQVKVTPVAGAFEVNQCIWLNADGQSIPEDRVLSAFIATVEGYQNQLFFNYYRLKLDHYLTDTYITGDLAVTDAEILSQLRDNYGVYLTTDEATITRSSLPYIENGATVYQCQIAPKSQHLVWTGAATVKIKPTDDPTDDLVDLITNLDLGTIDINLLNPERLLPDVINHQNLGNVDIQLLNPSAY